MAARVFAKAGAVCSAIVACAVLSVWFAAHPGAAARAGDSRGGDDKAATGERKPRVLEPAEKYPGAAAPPDTQAGWRRYQTRAHPDSGPEEAQAGRTARGTPVFKRGVRDWPAETRHVFREVDRVYANGVLAPFEFKDSDGIRGQNTWMLWGQGNEVFWGWLQEQGYGLTDLLIVIDSRERERRFERGGLINQPGMRKNLQPLLGLYLDAGAAPSGTYARPRDKGLFEPYDREQFQALLGRLPYDDVDPNVYGYPSGVVGLRLWPNPDFFGTGAVAKQARYRWAERVERDPNRYYSDPAIHADPQLVRPFRVSMTCAFCHIAPHPLNPPANPAEPQWQNLSSVFGNAYWTAASNITRLHDPARALARGSDASFVYYLVQSQQPGTVDTSLISNDHINNPNTIIPLFDVPARMRRAALNPPERQSAANQLVRISPGPAAGAGHRHTPRALIDGADSVGLFGSLARVYLNTGTFSEEWRQVSNPIVGVRTQRPFGVATAEEHSPFWRAGNEERVRYLEAFFTGASTVAGQSSVAAPMRLAHVARAKPAAPKAGSVSAGRAVFLQNCAICHSSKQPADFRLTFSREWQKAAAPKAGEPAHFTLPMDFAEWGLFTRSAAYAEYRTRIAALAGSGGVDDAFLKGNFLSTEIRVPVTLVGTNSARAVATNAMTGQVWDHFSSEDYKNLPPVGPVRFFNPYSGVPPDESGNNDAYAPPGGGPGYYRPPSLISLWATAPYLHNNALGLFRQDPKLESRLETFDDGIDKLLLLKRRYQPKQLSDRADAERFDIRQHHRALAGAYPEAGWIWRTPETSYLQFERPFVRELVTGVLGTGWVRVLELWLWLGLVLLFAALALRSRPRHAAFVLMSTAVVVAAVLALTRLDRVWWWLWLVAIGLAVLALWLWAGKPRPKLARGVLVVYSLGALVIGTTVWLYLHERLGGVHVGPIPKGTPVNLVINLNPDAPASVLLEASGALVRGMLLARRELPSKTELQAAAMADAQARLRQTVAAKHEKALAVFEREAGPALLKASKCPDFVLDRGHTFGAELPEDQKRALKAFLMTL